jgi:hypothetical protein
MDEPDDPLPHEVRRFAPWTWSFLEVVGVGLTLGAVCSASWLVVSYLAGW